MNQDYADIRARIAEEPTWFDVYGVPRYGQPADDILPWMGRIRCQNCRQEFWVCLVDDVYRHYAGRYALVNVGEKCPHDEKAWHLRLANAGLDHSWDNGRRDPLPEGWHYGDPPIHGCGGDTMNSMPEYIWDDEDWSKVGPRPHDETEGGQR